MSSRLQQLARAVTVLGDQSRGPARTVDAVSARIDGAAGIISAMPDVPERGQALSPSSRVAGNSPGRAGS